MSTHAPQFWSKTSFYFEIKPCHDYAAERSSHHCRLAFRADGEQKSLLCPSPFTFPSTQSESADSPSVFLSTCSPQLNPGVKAVPAPAADSSSSLWAINNPYRHSNFLIGHSFLCFLLLPPAKNPSLSLFFPANGKQQARRRGFL